MPAWQLCSFYVEEYMARGINKVILIGNLGADPETRYTPSGSAVTNISVATSEKWKDKNTGEQKEATEWHRVVFFDKIAEVAGEYLRKGSLVYIEGKIKTRKWQDQSGQDRYTTEVVVNRFGGEMQMLGGRGDSGGTASFPAEDQAASAAPATTQQQKAPAAPQAASADVGDDFDDDIPF